MGKNQDLAKGISTDYYTSGWFRNNNNNQGMYNQTNANHFYSRAGNRWGITGNGTSSNIYLDFYANHETTLRGSVHADTSNNIGFLNPSGSWSSRTDSSGNFTATGSVTAYSDKRLKENFINIEHPLEKIKKLNGGTFTWKTGIDAIKIKAGRLDYGIIADEVQEIMPELVIDITELDGSVYKTVDYTKIIPLLIEAIKEQQIQIEELQTKIKG